MRPEARYAAAIEVLDAWQDGMAAEQALTRWARGARYAGSKDRAAVRDHVYDVLRRKNSCAAHGGGETGRALILGLLRLGGVDPALIFSGEGHAPSKLSPSEETAPRNLDIEPLDVKDWMLLELDDQRIEDQRTLLAAMTSRAEVWLRVNTRKASPAVSIDMLQSEGVLCEPHGNLPAALRVTDGARRVRHTQAYSEGLVEVQDLSPQMAIARLDLPQTGRVLDYCAGGGGKALAIAAGTEASIFAHDAIPRRMADLPARATRAGVSIEQIAPSDLGNHAPYDLVVTDVPCSGSGTWRRDPEVKWRLTPERLAELVAVQAGILDEAAALVAANGQLVYMTCSLFRAENDAQIDGFLARRPGWICTARHFDTPLTASDGFFSAVLARKTDSPDA
ncbi:RsmB/NOP family class I SAM-dependent RNA methyltransferase [Gymnodinialimonas hymeniacidonis]|uniref:RsmB/NOP family class I SAM-dependent RNA methyltransferase n=1 Tax=Gymnodinialimonas hymeniacidonis TaxID=3126508 RepID=UPI0034C6A95C